VLTFNSLKKARSKPTVISKITPIIQSDLGPTSTPEISNLSKGAKANSPNNTASTSRCTSFAFLAIIITPILNKAGKTRPMAVSSFTKPVFCMYSTRITVIIPVIAARMIKRGELRS